MHVEQRDIRYDDAGIERILRSRQIGALRFACVPSDPQTSQGAVLLQRLPQIRLRMLSLYHLARRKMNLNDTYQPPDCSDLGEVDPRHSIGSVELDLRHRRLDTLSEIAKGRVRNEPHRDCDLCANELFLPD